MTIVFFLTRLLELSGFSEFLIISISIRSTFSFATGGSWFICFSANVLNPPHRISNDIWALLPLCLVLWSMSCLSILTQCGDATWQWGCNDGGDDVEYNDFFDGDDHNDYMMMSITLKVRVRPEDSGKQMICQVKKTNHENLHIFFFVPIIFWFV